MGTAWEREAQRKNNITMAIQEKTRNTQLQAPSFEISSSWLPVVAIVAGKSVQLNKLQCCRFVQ